MEIEFEPDGWDGEFKDEKTEQVYNDILITIENLARATGVDKEGLYYRFMRDLNNILMPEDGV